MQQMVLKLDVHDDAKCKRSAMKIVSTIHGLDSISMDMKEQKLTITGNMDPVAVVQKLRKVFHTEILSIGPVKEPEKPKQEPEKPKQEPESQPQTVEYVPYFEAFNNYPIYPRYSYYPY